MKKSFVLLMTMLLVLGLVACGGPKTPETSAPTVPSTAATTEPTTVPTEPTTVPTTAPTEPAVNATVGGVDLSGLTAEEAAAVAKMLDAARTLAQAKKSDEPEEEQEEEQQAVENTAYFQMRQRIAELLSELDPSDAEVLTLRFGLEGGKPLTPEETGRKLGLTPEEVVSKESAALAKLRGTK